MASPPPSPEAPRRTLSADLRALLTGPRELWLIYLATFFEYIGIFSFLQTLPLWLSDDFGMDDTRGGWWAATQPGSGRCTGPWQWVDAPRPLASAAAPGLLPSSWRLASLARARALEVAGTWSAGRGAAADS